VALGEHPALNAHRLDGEIVEYEAVNVGIAADTPNGLVVPVLAGAERLPIADVAARSAALFAAARAGTLRPEDVTGATFTVSNLGMMGVSVFQPLVNPPQVAILSVGAGRGDAGRTTTLGLAADHRAVDGAQGARFLQSLREVIEIADAGVLAGR
jgi:pyruvate dehydrogenase E2 component (dihydrolipoamide acetyltransferase)